MKAQHCSDDARPEFSLKLSLSSQHALPALEHRIMLGGRFIGHQAVTRRCPCAVNVVDSEMTGPAFNAERQKVLTTIDHVYTALYTVELLFNLYATPTRSVARFFYILGLFLAVF
jgi:hypothetical protein